MIVIEHSAQTNLEHLEHFREKRKYGSSIFSFFELEWEEEDLDEEELSEMIDEVL